MEEAADALARLDETVAGSAPAMAKLLMLRSAQAIVAARDEPIAADAQGARAFAALLGWWYAAESREFVTVSPALRHCAQALDGTAEKVRGGRAFTLALLREGTGGEDDGSAEDADLLETTLRQAAWESWPSLVLAAELLAGECAGVTSLPAAISRVVAPMVGGVRANALVVAPRAGDAGAALHGLAVEAREVRRRVDQYGRRCSRAADRAREFGRGAGSALALLDLLEGTPAITVVGGAAALELTVPTLGAAVERLVGAGLLREITGRGRDRVFVYEPAIALAG